jgi:hypothetical protein
MKTILLSAAILFMATAAFSQTATSDVNATAKASTSTTVVSNAGAGAAQGTKKAVKAANSERKVVQEQSKADIQAAKKAADKDVNASVSTQTSLSAKTSDQGNISGNQTSLNQHSSASENTSINVNTTGLKEKGKMAGQHTASTAVKAKENVKTTVNATGTKVETKTKAVKQTIKPKPASVKMNAHIAAANGIRIK